MKILLDCGHCLKGGDTGASGCGYREENLTRQIGYELRDVLEGLGHNVVICSCDSANSLGESLAYRVNKANREGGDLYVSIHLNAFNGEAYGTEVYTYGGNNFVEAERALNNITKLGYTNRGIKDGKGLYVIRNTDMKAMLIECCFIDNENDMGHFNFSNIANAIASGITGEKIEERKADLPEDFNETFYLWAYEDVANAVKNGTFKSGAEHYQNYGAFEGRQYKPTLPQDFNESIYLEFNKDVAAAIPKSFSSAADHYLNFGYRENRIYKEPEEAYIVTKKLSYSECKKLEEKLGDIVDRIEI